MYGSYNARTINIKEIDIKSSSIKKNHQILFISDVHLGTNNKKHLVKIIKKINKLNFDFLLIGGDLIDSSSFDFKDLNILKEINKPIYFVSGNHEYYLKDYQNKINQLASFNIKHLKNTKIHIEDISNYYETPSWPNKKFPKFFNVILKIKSNHKLIDLFKIIKHVIFCSFMYCF